MSYLTQAHARLVHFLASPPAEIQLYPTAEDFKERKEYLDQFAHEVTNFLYALANDTSSNTSAKINAPECLEVVKEAIEQTDFYCSLDECAERVVADALEAAE